MKIKTIMNSELDHLESIACGLSGVVSILDMLSINVESEHLTGDSFNCAGVLYILINNIHDHVKEINNLVEGIYERGNRSNISRLIEKEGELSA